MKNMPTPVALRGSTPSGVAPVQLTPIRSVIPAQAGIQSCPYLRGVVRNISHHRWSECHCAKSVLSRERVLEHALPADGPLQCTKETSLSPCVHLDIRRHADHGVRFGDDRLSRVKLQLEQGVGRLIHDLVLHEYLLSITV